MVKRREHYQNETTGFIEPEAWLQYVSEKRKPDEFNLIKQAYSLAQLSGISQPTPTGESCLQQGLGVANILEQLDLDAETIASALVFPSVHYADLSLDDVAEQTTVRIAKLI